VARKRDPKRDEAFELWKQHDGEITNRAIAEQLDVDEKKVAVWKQRDKWNVVQQTKNNVVQQTRSRGAPHGNSNAKGNKGNKNAAPPKQNSNALKHGFFSKFLPPETLEIMEGMNERSPADLIWDQIQIQYAAIIRAQSIMFVQNQDDTTSVIKKEKPGAFGDEIEYEVQLAWDKHATFLNAQSRAMSEFRSLIKQFDEMAHINDERRLKLEGMQLGIEKTKADITKVRSETKGTGNTNISVVDFSNLSTEELRAIANAKR